MYIILGYRETIENKKNGCLSLRTKEFAWDEVTNVFRSSQFVTKVTTNQLKRFYENIRRRAKSKITEDILILFNTGETPCS